jgi:F0F1-type ATP synthase membrane subunit a
MNPASDINVMLIFCEDCVIGTLITLIPMVGFRTYMETTFKDIPLITIPFFVIIEMVAQTMRVLSISLRMAVNVTATHNLFLIIMAYTYTFITYSITLKYQFIGIILVVSLAGLLTLDSCIGMIQSYVIIILETYYELDSE